MSAHNTGALPKLDWYCAVLAKRGSQGQSDELKAIRDDVAELIKAAHSVSMIPSPVGTGYPDGSSEDRAYIQGFNYALRLVREPGLAAGLNAALARIDGAA